MKQILLVEDDPDLAAGLQFALEEEGYTTKHATNMKEARALLGEPFDLTVLDVMLPDGNGFDLCREIRQRSGMPVLFLTSRDDELDIVKGLDGGGDDYVTKPFQLRVLLSRIKALLRRGNSGTNLQLGNIWVDTEKGRAYAGTAELSLTSTEYRLLSMLLGHAGQILQREQLLGYLWDSRGEYIDDNTLSVHIRHLREKLSASGSTAVIETVRGLGYRMEMKP